MADAALDYLWSTESVNDLIYDETKHKFRQSLVQRAEKRIVQQISSNRWVVIGDSSLGDEYESYDVELYGTRYMCSCFLHAYGDTRAKRICSHVLAVILWRKKNRVQVQEDESDSIPDPRDPMFGIPPIPSKFKKFYPHQWRAIESIVEAFKNGTKVVMLDAPTGSGKTLIAEAVRRLLKTKALYVCTTKTLQDQFMRDFGEYAKLLKGRSNYPTLDYPEKYYLEGPDRLTAADCEKHKVQISCEEAGCDDPYCNGEHYKTVCPWCHDTKLCPYQVAKREAFAADLAVMNIAYCLSEFNGPGMFSDHCPLMIIDEADELETELMRHIEVTISARTRHRLGIGTPARKTVEGAWDKWVKNEALPAIEIALGEAKRELNKDKANPSISLIRWKQHLEKLKDSLEKCDLLSGNWVYTGYEGEEENFPVIFKPVKVTEQAKELLWKHAKQFLMMSATVIDPEGMAEDLGIDSYEVVRVENTFPKERRPIYIIPKANMTHKNRNEAYPKLLDAIDKILTEYPQDRILIHTVSYDLTRYLYQNLDCKERLLYYASADQRNMVLERYKQTPGAVIIAPSLSRGVDLKDDLCKVVIVAKIPFPNLGDKQVTARLYSHGGERWYRMQTIRTLVQMTGRGMRSKDDQCDIYILDQQFVDNIWKKSRTLLPEWWREAIIRSGNSNIKL